jgi:hypothetical protein
MKREQVAQCVAEYLSGESVQVASVVGFGKEAWKRVTEEKIPANDSNKAEEKYLFAIVADPASVPANKKKLLSPHKGWKLVFAAQSGGSGYETSSTPPAFTFSNEDNEEQLWTKMDKGNVERPILSDDILPTISAANIYVYQRKLNNKEYCVGKMVNILGQQLKVQCASHKVPLIKVGRVDETCARRDCSNKSTYVCREKNAAGNKCVVSLCLKHFKEASKEPDAEVFVRFDSRGQAVPQESYRVTISVPSDNEEEEAASSNLPPEANLNGEVVPNVGSAREAEKLERFEASLSESLINEEGLVYETCPGAEKPTYGLFPNRDRMYGQYLFNE